MLKYFKLGVVFCVFKMTTLAPAPALSGMELDQDMVPESSSTTPIEPELPELDPGDYTRSYKFDSKHTLLYESNCTSTLPAKSTPFDLLGAIQGINLYSPSMFFLYFNFLWQYLNVQYFCIR